MFQILRKEGWQLNPDDKIINGVLKGLQRNHWECPCQNNSWDKKCPCSDYRENDICHCTLYIKDK